jgi:chemotaxis signal transduction protein
LVLGSSVGFLFFVLCSLFARRATSSLFYFMTQQSNIHTHQLPAPFLAVIFRIGGESYGLAVETVREIVNVPALLPIAGAPGYLAGLLNLRGVFLPVLDGRVLVSQPLPIALNNQVIILGGAAAEFGLLIDQALTIEQVTPLPSTALPRCAKLPLFEHLLSYDQHAAFHIDLDGLRALLPARLNETVSS